MNDVREIISARTDKSQILVYDNPLFSCIAKQSYYNPDMYLLVPEHWHEELEYIYVIDGKLEFSVNGEHMLLNPGEGICVNSKRIHSNLSKKGDYCLFYYALIHPSYICASTYIEQKYVTPVIGPASFDYLLLSKDNENADSLNDFLELFENDDKDLLELRIIEMGYRELGRLYKKIKPESSYAGATSAYIGTFKAMVTYINDHYMDKISLEDIASSGNVGKTLCAKIFKKFAAKTPGDYLIHYRIIKSMSLLNDNEQNITDIAYRTGFNSASHYTKTFRELVGCTPNKYRSADYSVREQINRVQL